MYEENIKQNKGDNIYHYIFMSQLNMLTVNVLFLLYYLK